MFAACNDDGGGIGGGGTADDAARSADSSAGAGTTAATTASLAADVDSGGGSHAAAFVCDTIRTMRADFAGVEDDLTSGGWINGFVAALGNAPDEAAYGDVVEGRADAPAAALCPDDWAEYLTRAEITTLADVDVLAAPID